MTRLIRDEKKLDRVRAAMRQAGLDGLVAHIPENVVYPKHELELHS